MEEWKPVMGWDSFYEVSNQGRVRRVTGACGTWAGRLLKPLKNGNGYVCVVLSRENKIKRRYIHILVAEAFLGTCPDGKEVNHKNGDRTNPKIENLEYVTRSENALHSFSHLGRKGKNPNPPCGEKHGNAKLTAKDAREIVRLYKRGSVTQMSLARQFGIHQSIVSDIVRGSLWSSITQDLF